MKNLFQYTSIYFDSRTSSQQTNKAALISLFYVAGHTVEIPKSALLFHQTSPNLSSYSGIIQMIFNGNKGEELKGCEEIMEVALAY